MANNSLGHLLVYRNNKEAYSVCLHVPVRIHAHTCTYNGIGTPVFYWILNGYICSGIQHYNYSCTFALALELYLALYFYYGNCF